MNLNKGLIRATRHATIVNITKLRGSVFVPGDLSVILEDNRGSAGVVQKQDADETVAAKSGDHTIHLFLGFSCTIESIVRISRRKVKESTFAQSSLVNSALAARRITRGIGSTVAAGLETNASKR